MHICFDATAALHQRAGIGRYGREMLPRLRSGLADGQLSMFTNAARTAVYPPTVEGLLCRRLALSNKVWRARIAADYLLQRNLDRQFEGVDLFFAADHLLPRFRNVRSIINIRDLSYLLYPQFHSRYSRVFQRLLMPHFARQATHIIVPSEATRHDVVAHYQIAPSKITVVPEGVDDRFRAHQDLEAQAAVRQQYNLPNPYILYVGTLEPRKNIRGLVDAFAALIQAPHLPQIDLVLAGGLGWLYEPTLAHIEQLGLGSRVRRIGRVDEAQLPALYGAAELFAFPSWHEGFGLPPLEAMACGTPVVTSNVASLPEVIGDAGLLVAPDDIQGLAQAMRSVLEQDGLRERLRVAGPHRAAQFTWERTAAKTLALCREVVGANRA